MPKTKIIFVLIILFILLNIIVMFVSCAEQNGDENKSDTLTETESGKEAENTAGSETARLLPNLGEADFGGYVFRVLNRTTTVPDSIAYIPRDVYAEAMNGETVNDAVYQRNAYLENKYNFSIVQLFWDSAEITNYMKNDRNLGSMFEKRYAAMESDIQKVIEKYEELN